MAIKQISPSEAKNLLDQDESLVYLDVRSEGEFKQGHPRDAYNIPIKHLNITIQQLVENPDFVNTVQSHFPNDAKLILGCGSGARSQAACELLELHGYHNLANVDGGFSGARDMFGNVIKEGWMQLNLPVENGYGDERSYKTLQQTATGS